MPLATACTQSELSSREEQDQPNGKRRRCWITFLHVGGVLWRTIGCGRGAGGALWLVHGWVSDSGGEAAQTVTRCCGNGTPEWPYTSHSRGRENTRAK